MPGKPYDFAVIGGDMRHLYLVEKLAATRHFICHFGLCGTPMYERAQAVDSLKQAVEQARFVIGPIPLGKYQDIVEYLECGQVVLAGCIPEALMTTLQAKGITVIDLMLDEPFAIYNSIATAEGALCEAITRSSVNLHSSNCAVLGYGRCGRTLVHYLRGMFCRVDVYTPLPKEQAEAKIIAEQVFSPQALGQTPGKYDYIFNTIPAQIIRANFLKKVKEQAVIIDIAAAPGGIDYDAALKYHVCAWHCPGLPGKYAPLSSAEAIAAVIERVNE